MEGAHVSKNSQKGFVKRILAKARLLSVFKKIKTASTKPVKDTSHGVLRSQPEVASITLPEDLVETIVAMLPFPQIFKARALSKSWRARFDPIPSLHDEVQKLLATSFQKKVTEWSTNWKTFCPVLIDWEQGLLAYDRESEKFVRMLSFLPDDFPNRGRVLPDPYYSLGVYALRNELIVTRQQIEGAFLLFSSFRPLGNFRERRTRKRRVSNFVPWSLRHLRPVPAVPREWPRGWPVNWCGQAKVHTLTVANLLTRRWKQLPSNPFVKPGYFFEASHYLFEKLVMHASLGTYKVIVFYRRKEHYLVQIYDSGSNAWRRRSFVHRAFFGLKSPEYLNGVLYMLAREPKNHILAFNVEDETLDEIEILGDIMGRTASKLVAGNGNLLIVVEGRSYRDAWHLLSLDLESRGAFEVAQIPQTARGFNRFSSLTSSRTFGRDGDCICYQVEIGTSYGMLVYNQHEDAWSIVYFPQSLNVHLYANYQTSFVLKPNLNPFMAV